MRLDTPWLALPWLMLVCLETRHLLAHRPGRGLDQFALGRHPGHPRAAQPVAPLCTIPGLTGAPPRRSWPRSARYGPVPYCRASGLVGGTVPGQQRVGRQALLPQDPKGSKWLWTALVRPATPHRTWSGRTVAADHDRAIAGHRRVERGRTAAWRSGATGRTRRISRPETTRRSGRTEGGRHCRVGAAPLGPGGSDAAWSTAARGQRQGP